MPFIFNAFMRVFIKKQSLLSCLQGAKNLFPNEFLGLLKGIVEERRVVVNELLIAPLSKYGAFHSSFSPLHLPTDPSVIGSFHSHPATSSPSKTDLEFFSSFGAIHLIARPPYSIDSVTAYDRRGKRIELVVE